LSCTVTSKARLSAMAEGCAPTRSSRSISAGEEDTMDATAAEREGGETLTAMSEADVRVWPGFERPTRTRVGRALSPWLGLAYSTRAWLTSA